MLTLPEIATWKLSCVWDNFLCLLYDEKHGWKISSAWRLEDSMKNNILNAFKLYWNWVLKKVNITRKYMFDE